MYTYVEAVNDPLSDPLLPPDGYRGSYMLF